MPLMTDPNSPMIQNLFKSSVCLQSFCFEIHNPKNDQSRSILTNDFCCYVRFMVTACVTTTLKDSTVNSARTFTMTFPGDQPRDATPTPAKVSPCCRGVLESVCCPVGQGFSLKLDSYYVFGKGPSYKSNLRHHFNESIS